MATSLNRRDEHPNIDLAIRLAGSGDKDAIDELFDIIDNSKSNRMIWGTLQALDALSKVSQN